MASPVSATRWQDGRAIDGGHSNVGTSFPCSALHLYCVTLLQLPPRPPLGAVTTLPAAARWRWVREPEPGDPLYKGAAHFAPPGSALVFEPARQGGGGVGVAAAPALLEMGLVAVGHFCLRDGAAAPRWFASLAEAAEVYVGLRKGAAVASQWGTTMAALRLRAGPCAPERPAGMLAGWQSDVETREAARRARELGKLAGGQEQLRMDLTQQRDVEKAAWLAGRDLEKVRRLPSWPMLLVSVELKCRRQQLSCSKADSEICMDDGSVRNDIIHIRD